MNEYTLDTTAARQADTGSDRINETGKYIGQFTKAKKVLSKKGTKGIEFSFKSDEGQTADYLTLWTTNKDGEQIYGFKQLMALMTCLKIKALDSSKGTVEEYDRDAGGMVTRDAELFTGLMNKPIGVLLQMEEYEKTDGSIGEKASFAGFFEAATDCVAVEVLERRSPEILDRIISQLVDIKKLKPKPSQTRSYSTAAPQGKPAPNFSDIDDDVPF